MSWELKKDQSTYILRYYLPCEPIYPKEVTEQRAKELIEYCLQNRIEAVMLYVDLNPNWYYMPDSIEHTDYYVPIVAELGKTLREHGISYQLNYQNLFGSWDGGADLRSVCEWENFVDEEGLESWGCACSIGKRFREKAGYKLTAWAKTAPDAIWIDDDIRFSHHRASVREFWSGKIPAERLDFGCFCDEHIALFNRKNGTSYTREQIKTGIFEGNALRKLWLTFSGECVDEVSRWIADTVHAASPDTRVAIMTSNPDTHNTEGRRWGSFLKSISGGDRPLLRPTFGPYVEYEPKAFFNSYAKVSQLKADIAATYGTEVDFCPEIENTRFTRWAKSMAATGYQLCMGAFLGARGITLSVYDLDGCQFSEEPEIAQLLNERRPLLDRLAKYDLWNYESEGMGLVTAPDRIKDTHHAVGGFRGLCSARFWDERLLTAGIPCKYITPDRFEAETCAVLDGHTAKLLTDQEIKILLSKNLLLDAAAALEIQARGFGSYLGVDVGDTVDCIGGKEIFDTLSHSDGSMVQAPLRIPGGKWRKLTPCGAGVLSRIVTPYGTELPGFTAYENELSGRVVVYASDGAVGDGFYSNFRIRFLKDLCAELSQTVKADNHSAASVAVKRRENEQFVFFAPLAADLQKDVTLTTPRPAKIAEFYDIYGNAHPCTVEGNRILCKDANVRIYESIIVKIND